MMLAYAIAVVVMTVALMVGINWMDGGVKKSDGTPPAVTTTPLTTGG